MFPRLLLFASILLTGCGASVAPSATPTRLPTDVAAPTIPSPNPTAVAPPLPVNPSPSGPAVVPGRVIVGYRPGTTAAERADILQEARSRGALPGTVIAPVGPDAELVDVSAAVSIDTAIRAYLADPRVRYAEPDVIVRTTG